MRTRAARAAISGGSSMRACAVSASPAKRNFAGAERAAFGGFGRDGAARRAIGGAPRLHHNALRRHRAGDQRARGRAGHVR